MEIAGAISDRFAVRPSDDCKTANAVRPATPVRWVFRAGVWKPRSRPDSFQGAGAQALEWLAEVKRTYGVPVATEVATPEHVEAALNAGIDYLWLGARTSANPIAVAEIAKAIDRFAVRPATPVGLLIKNPVNPDAGLWIGNIERLTQTGVPVIAVHRGCNHHPCWSMAHEVRLARPDIPMLLDPSHMSGDATKVPELLNYVAELGLDGAMIEVHNKPSEALSDAKQQITPEDICHLPLVIGHLSDDDKTANAERRELNWMRAEIDELDETLWQSLAARMEVSQRIGEWKKAHGVAPLQPQRYQEIVEKIKGLEMRGLEVEFMLRIWSLIHEESLRKQE